MCALLASRLRGGWRGGVGGWAPAGACFGACLGGLGLRGSLWRIISSCTCNRVVDLPSASPTPPSTPCKTSSAAQVIIYEISVKFYRIEGNILRDPNLTISLCLGSAILVSLERRSRALVVRWRRRCLRRDRSPERDGILIGRRAYVGNIGEIS